MYSNINIRSYQIAIRSLRYVCIAVPPGARISADIKPCPSSGSRSTVLSIEASGPSRDW